MAKQFSEKADVRGVSKPANSGWIDQELAGCAFQDERLTKRFEKLFRQLPGSISESIPWRVKTGQIPRRLIGSLPTSG